MSELKNCPFCGKPAKWEKNFLIGGIARCSDYQCIGAFTHLSRSASCEEWNTRPTEDALKAENESLKNKLSRVKEHLVIHRDSALNNIREDKDQCRKAQNEFLAWFCNRLIEVINADTGKGGGLEEKAVFQTEEKGKAA